MSFKKQYILKKGMMFIASRHIVRYPDGDTREIRYCPNDSSIFVDEQKDTAKEKKIYAQSTLFTVTNKNLYKYIEELRKDVKVNFIIPYDPNATAKKANELLTNKYEAIKLVMEAEDADILSLGYMFLGKSDFMVFKDNLEEIKRRIFQITETRPKEVKELLEKKKDNLKLELFAGLAFSKEVLEYHYDTATVKLKPNNELVLTMADNGEDEITQVAKFLKSAAGSSYKTKIATYLKQGDVKPTSLSEIKGIGDNAELKLKSLGFETTSDLKYLTLNEFKELASQHDLKFGKNKVEDIYESIQSHNQDK